MSLERTKHYLATRYPEIVLAIIVFIAIAVFFGFAHPLFPFDVDDWTYISHHRHAIPQLGEWNPTRVFPEVLQPNCALFATFFIAPIVEDWVTAQIVMNALVASIFITIYAIQFYKLLADKTSCSRLVVMLLSLTFIGFHFLALRTAQTNNVFFFFAYDVTAFYFYIIPNMLCASLVLYFMRVGDPDEALIRRKGHLVSKSILVACLYFGIFSNLFASILISSYVVINLLFDIVRREKGSFKLGDFLLKNRVQLLILVIWLVAQLFEMTGGRAASLEDSTGLLAALLEQVQTLLSLRLNLIFLLVIVLTFFISFVMLCMARFKVKSDDRPVLKCFLCALVCLLYLIVVCAKTGPDYTLRPGVLFCVFFYVCLAAFILIAIFFATHRACSVFLPLLIIIVLNQINTPGATFRNLTMNNLPTETSIALTKDVISQIEEGASNNLDLIEVQVPSFDHVENWPIATTGNQRIEDSIMEHGLASGTVTIEVVPTNEKNAEYGIKPAQK